MYQSKVFANGDMPIEYLTRKAESTKIDDDDPFTMVYNDQRTTVRDFRPDAPTFAHEMKRDTTNNTRMALTLRQGGSRFADVPYRPDLFTGFLDADPRGTVNTPNLRGFAAQSASRKVHFKLFPDGPDATVEGEKPAFLRNRQRDKSLQITKERLPIFSTSLDYIPGITRNYITTAGGAALVDTSATPTVIVDDMTNRAYVSEANYRIGDGTSSVTDHPIKIAYYSTPHARKTTSSTDILYDSHVSLSGRDLEQITRALRQKISATHFDTEEERKREIERLAAPYRRMEAFKPLTDKTTGDTRSTYYDRIVRALSGNEKFTSMENNTIDTQRHNESVIARIIRAGAQVSETTLDSVLELTRNPRTSKDLANSTRHTARYEVKDMTTETARRAASMEVAPIGILNKTFARQRGEFTAVEHKTGLETASTTNHNRRTTTTTQTEGVRSMDFRVEEAPVGRSRSGHLSNRPSTLSRVEKDDKSPLEF